MEVRPTESALRLCLYLSYLRSMAIVGQALAQAFPSEAEWQELRNDPEFLADLNHFTSVMESIKQEAIGMTPDRIPTFVGAQYDIAIDAVRSFADRYKIPIHDLVYVLING